jgi:hypothetical protein
MQQRDVTLELAYQCLLLLADAVHKHGCSWSSHGVLHAATAPFYMHICWGFGGT